MKGNIYKIRKVIAKTEMKESIKFYWVWKEENCRDDQEGMPYRVTHSMADLARNLIRYIRKNGITEVHLLFEVPDISEKMYIFRDHDSPTIIFNLYQNFTSEEAVDFQAMLAAEV